MADYCTQRDMMDVYPHLDEFDTKTPIYNWVTYVGNTYVAQDCGTVTRLFENGKNWKTPQTSIGAVNSAGKWYYDSTADAVYFYSTTDPNDKLMEAGEDFATLIARYITNASRFFDSMVNSVLPREQFKNADGTYDYVVIRTTALIAVAFLIRASDPDHPQGAELYKEAMATIEGLTEGSIKLIKDITVDAPKGVLRTVTHTSGKMLPVDTRGEYSGTYDKIKIKITTSGGINTGKFTASVKNANGLKQENLTAQLITGDYQPLAGGIEIRFAANSTDTTSWDAAVNDEWELEVYGKGEEVDRPSGTSWRGTRL